jgi:hypothetical protein
MARTNNLTDFLTDVSSAIKQKTGDNTPIPASDFDTEILSIETAGNYQSKTLDITQNGNYNLLPDQEFDAISNVNISVSVSSVLQNKTITENGSYTADQNYDGLGTVIVNVQGSTINNQDKEITENGVYAADEGYTGLGTVTVNVPSTGGDTSDATISPDKIQIGEIGYGRTGRMVGTLPTTNTISNGSSDSHTQANLTQYSTLLEDGIKAEFDVNSKSIILADSKATMYISVNQIANLIGLTADKIKAGVVVLGISGTYTGEGGSAPDYTGTVPPSEYDIAVKTSLIILGELKEE